MTGPASTDARSDGGAPLAPGQEALVDLSAALAAGDREALRAAMAAADARAEPEAVEEALLQSYLFLGYPAALRALALWREVSGRPAPPAAGGDPAEWRRRGEEVCRTVYGGQYERLRENVRALSEDLEEWMVTEGYGKVLGRPGLDLATRELCVAATLAVLGAAKQLYSHLRGALEAGAPARAVEAALERALRHADDEGRSVAWATWKRVAERRRGSARR